MEYVEGETLAARLERGAMPVDQAQDRDRGGERARQGGTVAERIAAAVEQRA